MKSAKVLSVDADAARGEKRECAPDLFPPDDISTRHLDFTGFGISSVRYSESVLQVEIILSTLINLERTCYLYFIW